MEENVLRCARQMSPRRESYPLDIKAWETNLRSKIPKINYSDYYIANTQQPLLSKTNTIIQKRSESHNSSSLAADQKSSALQNQSSSLLKSHFNFSTASQTLSKQPKLTLTQDEYLNKIMELETENQKYIDLCNNEIRNHSLEKKKWSEIASELKLPIIINPNSYKIEEVSKEKDHIQEEFRLYKEKAEKKITELQNEVNRLSKILENHISK